MPSEQVGEMIEISYNIDIVEGTEDNVKVIKRNLPVKKLVAIQDIKNPTQIFNKKGAVVKTKCRIYLKDEGELIINKSYEQVKQIITEKKPKRQAQIGFKLKKRNKNVKSGRRNKAHPEQYLGGAGERGQHADQRTSG
jgi:hypothetical protein